MTVLCMVELDIIEFTYHQALRKAVIGENIERSSVAVADGSYRSTTPYS